MKVLHGTFETAHQIEGMTTALRLKNIYAKSVCYNPTYLRFQHDYTFRPNNCRTNEEAIKETSEFADFFIDKFDIFHFHFGHTLAADYSDLRKIKDKGKKVIMHFWGSDVRRGSISKKINPYYKIKPMFQDESDRIKLLEGLAPFVDIAVVGSWELYDHVAEYFDNVIIIYPVVDIETYSWKNKSNGRIKIVHAPTDPDFKGSARISQVIDELKNDYEFDFIPVMAMPHHQAKQVYSQADLIIDELHCGDYGVLSIEGMAMGKAVMTWICDEVINHRPEDMPIITVNPDTLKDKLIWYFNNQDEVQELRDAGRKYAREYHGMETIGKQLIDLYEAVLCQSRPA